MYAAISQSSGNCEVIVLGSNAMADSSKWRFPEDLITVARYDALAQPDSGVRQALIHVHPGIVTFHEISFCEDPPSDWIRGISSLRPHLNAQNLRAGSREDREFIARSHRTRSSRTTPLKAIGETSRDKFIILDLEGLDFDVCASLFNRSDVVGIGCEHALMSDAEVIHLRCTALECGFYFDFSDEDAIFLRESLLTESEI